MQREFFRKRPKDEQSKNAETTIQDSIFEKLEASSKNLELFHHETNVLPQKLHSNSTILSSCIQSRPLMQQLIAPKLSARKIGQPEMSMSQGVRPSATDADELVKIAAPWIHDTPQRGNFSMPVMSTMLSMQLRDDETKTAPTRRDGPLGKPIIYRKSITSHLSSRKCKKTSEPKLNCIISSTTEMEECVQVSAPAMHYVPQRRDPNPSKCANSSALSMPQDCRSQDQMISPSSPLSFHFDIPKDQSTVSANATKTSRYCGDKKPRTFIDVSTRCAPETEVLSLKFDNPYQTFALQLPANYSQMPRSGQYILSMISLSVTPELA